MRIEGDITSVEFDVHRWYTVVRVTRADGSVVAPVIGQAFPGEGPGLFDSYEEWEVESEG